MIKAILWVVVNAVALVLISRYVPGIAVANYYTAFIVAVLWGVIGWTLKPVLNLLALPINIITFGLFSFIISALLLWLLATFVAGFTIAGFVPALVAALILALVNWLLHAAL